MKNRIFAALLALVCVLSFSACSCSHESWAEPEGGGPKTCARCGISECEVNGHSWFAATCEAPKTCENCGLTEGEALGHDWEEATCDKAKTCKICGTSEGTALGHSWIDATTEEPKTCEVCAATEGDRIITDGRFKTANCSMLFGKWQGIVTLPGDELEDGLGDYIDELSCVYILEFTNDGKMNVSFYPEHEEEFIEAMIDYTTDVTYAEFAASGIDAETADALVQQNFGMTTREYVASELSNMNVKDVFSAFSISFVYFVEGDQIFLGVDWSYMEPDSFSILGEVLYLPLEGEDDIPFTRVTE